MAKGSVRKKGKKWYYRFYVEDASGKMVQKEYAGTESKSETEKLLRKALEDYENKKFVAKADSLTVGELLDMWAEEKLKTGTLSNGTVENYLGAIRCIKKHPIAERKLKTVTAEHLQSFLDLLTFGGEFPDGKVRKGYSKDYIHSFSAVLQQSFRFAVFARFVTFQVLYIAWLDLIPSVLSRTALRRIGFALILDLTRYRQTESYRTPVKIKFINWSTSSKSS